MIKEFQGDYRWLSNFAPVDIEYEGVMYHSVEHAYQSAKSPLGQWKEMCREIVNPAHVKQASRKIKIREDWDQVKIAVMRELLLKKFYQEHFKSLLKETGDAEIQEGNWWGDKFWGVSLHSGEGENHLGKLIMEIRSQL